MTNDLEQYAFHNGVLTISISTYQHTEYILTTHPQNLSELIDRSFAKQHLDAETKEDATAELQPKNGPNSGPKIVSLAGNQLVEGSETGDGLWSRFIPTPIHCFTNKQPILLFLSSEYA